MGDSNEVESHSGLIKVVSAWKVWFRTDEDTDVEVNTGPLDAAAGGGGGGAVSLEGGVLLKKLISGKDVLVTYEAS